MLPPMVNIGATALLGSATVPAFVPSMTVRPTISAPRNALLEHRAFGPHLTKDSRSQRPSKTFLMAKDDKTKSYDETVPFGLGTLGGPNLSLVNAMLLGESVVLSLANILGAFNGVNPFAGPSLASLANPQLWGLIVLGALPPFLGSVCLERSNIPFVKRIDQDTRLYVLQLFGAKRALPSVILASVALAVAAGVAEEALFRGFLLQGLVGWAGPYGALLAASALFGLAHNPVPGASAFVEAVYGLNFGLVYLVSGGNIWAAAACHALYDVLTFAEVHWRAAGRVEQALDRGDYVTRATSKDKEQLDPKVASVAQEYQLPPAFVRVCGGVFAQLDMDRSGTIDAEELRLGFRTFGGPWNENKAEELLKKADTNNDGQLSFDEFLTLIGRNARSLQSSQGRQ